MWLPDDPQAPSRLYCRSPRGPRDALRTVGKPRPVPGWALCWPSRTLLLLVFSAVCTGAQESSSLRVSTRLSKGSEITNCLRAVVCIPRSDLTDGLPQAQDSTVSGVSRLWAGRKGFGLVGGSEGGREEGEAWEETERSMLESSRVPSVPILKVVDGLPLLLPTAYCGGGGGVERGSWPVRSSCACEPNFCARRKEARRQGSKEVGYCLIRQFERRKAG